MINSAQDILFLVLSVCVTALTVFLVWFLWELIHIVRGIAKTIGAIEEKLHRIDELIRLVQEKLHDSTLALTTLTHTVSAVIGLFRAKRTSKTKKATDRNDEF